MWVIKAIILISAIIVIINICRRWLLQIYILTQSCKIRADNHHPIKLILDTTPLPPISRPDPITVRPAILPII